MRRLLLFLLFLKPVWRRPREWSKAWKISGAFFGMGARIVTPKPPRDGAR